MDDDKLKTLREAWLDVPFDATVPKGDGPWMQDLINAVSAIVDPDRTLRETPEALRRGRMASYRSQFAFWSEQLKLSTEHGIVTNTEYSTAKVAEIAAACLAEFGIALE